MNKHRWISASDLFCQTRVWTFQALLRNLMYKFICRLNVSQAGDQFLLQLSDTSITYVKILV